MVENVVKTKNQLLCERKVPNDFSTQNGDTYTWSWLPRANVQSLLNIRNAGHVLGHMRNKSPITEEMHLDFLQNMNHYRESILSSSTTIVVNM